MPELPEVEAARRAVQEHCVGKKIRKSTIADDPKVIDGVSPKDFEEALVGKTIVAAHRKGKNMWLQLDSPPFPSFQFGMSGAVYIKGVAVTKYKRSAVKDTDEWPSKYSKLFVELDDGLEFSFTDKRRFAKVRLLDNPLSVPPISELGPDALTEPMKVEDFYNSLSKKKIGIKALLLDQSFMSGIGNWMADEVLYQARIHPLQITSSISMEICATLLKCVNEVTEMAMDVGADSSQFPTNWIFHSREKKSDKAFVDGKKIEFINAGGRTTAYVPELQKLTGNQAVKEAAKPKPGSDDGSGEEKNEQPEKLKSAKGKKSSQAKKAPPAKKKSSSGSDDEYDNDDVDVSASKRTQGAKNPPEKSKPKGRSENEGEGQMRQTRGKTIASKKKHEGSDDDLSNQSSSGDDDLSNSSGKPAKVAASKKRAASNQNAKTKKKAK